MSELESVAQAASSFANAGEKLISVVEKATCGILKPRQMIRKAKAAVKVIDMFAEAAKRHPEIEFNYKSDELDVGRELQGLTNRAASRLAISEVKKQLNIENVIIESYNELKSDKNVNCDEPDSDWIMRFFNSVENVSNEEMQRLWAKVLSGEIKRPSSFSLKTLNILSFLSQTDCELIKRVSQFVIFISGGYALYRDFDLLSKYNISFNDITYLQELNIIDSSLFTESEIKECSENQVIFSSGGYVVIAHSMKNFEIPVLTFTSSGIQILSLFDHEINEAYNLEMLKEICNQNKSLTCHKINHINRNTINYNKQNIFDQSDK